MGDSSRKIQVWTSLPPEEFVDEFLVDVFLDDNVAFVKGWGQIEESGQDVAVTSGSHLRVYAPFAVGREPDIDLLVTDEWIERDSRKAKLLEMGEVEEAETMLAESEIEDGNARFLGRLIGDPRITHGIFVDIYTNACILFWSPEAVFRVDNDREWPENEASWLKRIADHFWTVLDPILQQDGRRIHRRTFAQTWESEVTDQHRLTT